MGESRAEVEAETVERVARLVTTAGATLKEKKRPIKVVARDGTIKKVVPHVEVIEGLLHHEGISGELQAGVRPKTVLCAVCKCVVEVPKRGGVVPLTCRNHWGKKLCPRGCGAVVHCTTQCCGACRTPAERLSTARKLSESLRKRHANKTPEERSDAARRASATMTPEQRSESLRKRHATMTPEQRSDAARKRNAALTREEHSDRARKRNAAMTPEQRSERVCKAWETRRAKKAAAEKAGDE